MRSVLRAFVVLALGVTLAASAQATITVNNASFESPTAGSWGISEGVAPDSWTSIHVDGTPSTFGAGIVANNSAYGNPNAVDGTQAAMLKGAGGMYQSISGFETGKQYSVSFFAAGRYFTEYGVDLVNPFQVSIGGTSLQFSGSTTITPAYNTYNSYSASFTATASTMNLQFLSTLTDTTDKSSYIDNVQITAVATPEPSTLILLTGGLLGLLAYAWKKRS